MYRQTIKSQILQPRIKLQDRSISIPRAEMPGPVIELLIARGRNVCTTDRSPRGCIVCTKIGTRYHKKKKKKGSRIESQAQEEGMFKASFPGPGAQISTPKVQVSV
ncbi:hypothetical protein PoB_000684900 [Plakobranchus ocellatus]|uniref:Uncharacterized protein n=1 Tax=Plakobranchus ocellatus TaxID=259542 RepID=A0AAV3YDK8_9GAST|nr:hypothetical protein PoB_000684900 [Plakobranchus ocellatus]